MRQDPLIKRNILFLDIIRGFAVVNMVIYHLLYDLVSIFGVRIDWFNTRPCFLWEQMICFIFILVSGISFRLSRAPWKNGIKLWGCAGVLTGVTMVVIPEERILFGILHFLGSAVLLTWIGDRWLKRIPAAAGILISLTLFLLTRQISAVRIDLPYLFWAGFPRRDFFSADYFPMLPWLFLFWTGYFGSEWWIRGSDAIKGRMGMAEDEGKRKRLPESRPLWVRAYRSFDGSLGVIGRNSLWIYMLHQPLLYGFLLLLL